ncbi:histidine--tRNA ligase [Ferroacidibacillus organovorans]|uniref:Histidine--tRNA ligase n=2 Tax=Ferroacidibacillus organovorans TaxID=1765683 RepID=A0A162T8T9_9BACL|nr:histidine--tRNA ligase [Ferroacidibacillus organovorans]KYP80573.1 histidine--tRNA ligase [Ferroacidibacillus organovorans]OAG93458.1 histidine--tRNA ligase [Ferroacidibacillus organovorans]OPG17073.1 histidine--tRNA ligase [Ferroacidibacillus organovorans]
MAMADFARPRGTYDIKPSETPAWQAVEDLARTLFSHYHFEEMRTPIFEHTEVFERGVGDTSDIVQKEMYTFVTRGEKSVTLRPEGTAGVVRAFVENKLYGGPLPAKLWYLGPMFRYEAPQAGRNRQFHQYGVEVIGSSDPRVDAEVIELGARFLLEAGVADARLELNSVGCPVCRAAHRAALIAHLAPIRGSLCADCQGRFEKNPLRILDCKKDRDRPEVKSSPRITEYLCADCQTQYSAVKHNLDVLGVSYVEDSTLVRGLDYYTQTTFEFVDDRIGAKSTLLAGGRYNGLVEQLGGPDMPGIGFAGGVERLLLARAVQEEEEGAAKIDAYIVTFGSDLTIFDASLRVLSLLRKAGVTADLDYAGRGVKAQMKTADRLGARVAVLLGDEEVANGAVTLRDLMTKEQNQVSEDACVEAVLALLSR